MEKKLKKYILSLLLVLCAVPIVFARKRHIGTDGVVSYVYEDRNEFYEYWEDTANGYDYVEIGILESKYSGYGFVSQMQGTEIFFVYQYGNKQLVALFTNYTEFLEDGFKRFAMGVFGHSAALRYWNALISNL